MTLSQWYAGHRWYIPQATGRPGCLIHGQNGGNALALEREQLAMGAKQSVSTVGHPKPSDQTHSFQNHDQSAVTHFSKAEIKARTLGKSGLKEEDSVVLRSVTVGNKVTEKLEKTRELPCTVGLDLSCRTSSGLQPEMVTRQKTCTGGHPRRPRLEEEGNKGKISVGSVHPCREQGMEMEGWGWGRLRDKYLKLTEKYNFVNILKFSKYCEITFKRLRSRHLYHI